MQKILFTFLSLTFTCNVYADLFSSSIVDGCSITNLGFTNSVPIDAVFTPKNITCPSGQFLPANHINCENCPTESTCIGGTYAFNETKHKGVVYNSLFQQNKNFGCSSNLLGITDNVSINAVFTPKNITCPSGQFLPANYINCANCPTESTCVGGTYAFNENKTQGIVYNSTFQQNKPFGCISKFLGVANNVDIIPVFEPKNITCQSGYYLIANDIDCTICPAGNKCVGGTYSFNETTSSGIESCNGSFAPTGSSVCYGHILHVGNESIYLSSTKNTTPSLNVAYGNDVFYANMTTVQTVMTAGSSHYLKTIYNNEIYYVCDDTSCPQ